MVQDLKKIKIKNNHLEIPVHYAVLMAVVDALQNLLNAMRRIRLAVEFTGDNVLE